MTHHPIQIQLPLPPSVNASTRNRAHGKGRGRIKTEAYTRWRSDAAWLLKNVRERLPERTPYYARVWVPIDRRSDLDNRLKAILDALKASGITPDDRWCDDLHARRVDPAERDQVWIEVGVF